MVTTWDNYYRILLALTMYREARGQGREGMRAVGHVIRNRVNARWGDWDHVITKKWQFSAISAPGDSQLVVWPDSPDAVFLMAMELADAIYEGRDEDPTKGALNYWNPKFATSKTFKQAVETGAFVETVRIKDHIFYRPAKREGVTA